MSKSALLRVQDVRDAYRLIGECRDLSSHPGLWQPHMFEGLRHLIGAAVGSGGEGYLNPPHPVQVVTIFDTFEPGDRAHFLAWVRDNGPVVDPLFKALERIPGSLVTRTRQQLIPDGFWYRSAAFNDYRRKAHVDHQLTSMSLVSPKGAISMLVVHRSVGERNFSAREQRLLHFFHQELTPLIGRALVSATEPTPNDLSPSPPTDTRMPAPGGQREAGRRASGAQPLDRSPIRHNTLSSVRRSQSGATVGACIQTHGPGSMEVANRGSRVSLTGSAAVAAWIAHAPVDAESRRFS